MDSYSNQTKYTLAVAHKEFLTLRNSELGVEYIKNYRQKRLDILKDMGRLQESARRTVPVEKARADEEALRVIGVLGNQVWHGVKCPCCGNVTAHWFRKVDGVHDLIAEMSTCSYCLKPFWTADHFDLGVMSSVWDKKDYQAVLIVIAILLAMFALIMSFY